MNAGKRMPSPDKAARTKATGKLIPSGIFAVGAVLACLLLFWNRPWTLEQQEFLLGEPQHMLPTASRRNKAVEETANEVPLA